MAFLSGWLAVLAVGLVAVITPGPDFVLTLRSSLAHSRQAGIYTAVGIGAGNLVHATYSLIGIGAIVSQSILLFNLLKGLGAAYLVYVGLKSLCARKAAVGIGTVGSRRTISRRAAFRIGFFGNLLNPKATLFFLALFTQVVQPATPVLVQAGYGVAIAALALIWFTLVAVWISQAGIQVRLEACSHWLERLSGAVLIAFGLRLAVADSSQQ
ncbi:MAG: LysE family transporter [Cyanobacteria bacterium Co-bin13]|nr:LysE family transporter [Cyanobacteria bacterium Co-bin13]